MENLYPWLIGLGYYYLEEYEPSIRYLDIAEKSAKPKDNLYPDILIALVNSYVDANDMAAAQEVMFKIHQGKIIEMSDDMTKANLYRTQASLYNIAKEYDAAIFELNKAEKIYKPSSQWTLPAAIPMYEKAQVHLDFQNIKQAKKEFHRAAAQLGITELDIGELASHPNLQYVLSTLEVGANILMAELEVEERLTKRIELDSMFTAIFESIELLLIEFSNKRASVLLKDYYYLYEKSINNSYQLYSKHGLEAHMIKAVGLSNDSKARNLKYRLRTRSEEQYSSLHKESIKGLRLQAADLKVQLLQNKIKGEVAAIGDLSVQLQEVKNRMAQIEGLYNTSLPQISSVDFLKIERNLEHNEAILEIFETPSVWYIWQFSSSGVKWFVESKSEGLNKEIRAFSSLVSPKYDFQLLRSKMNGFFKIIDSLYQSGMDELTIVADKSLSTLPLEFLYSFGHEESVHVSVNNKYCMEELSTKVGERVEEDVDLISWAPSYKFQKEGDVKDEYVAELVRSGKYNLPGAQKEARLVADITGGRAITGKDATKTSFLNNVENGNILHLSMHAIINREEDQLSKFLFSNEEGLEEDSYLHAIELDGVNISARLAVLSACETGLGNVEDGEGVMSLARSFAMAGVPSTVMTLWKVPDRSTSDMMRYFYESLLKGNQISIALREAKNRYKEECVDEALLHPYYWAGFVSVGSDEALYNVTMQGDHLKLWLLMAGVLILSLIWGLYKLKLAQ